MDPSLIDVDLRDYVQLRIIQTDTTSLIVPENELIRQIGNDVIQIPNAEQLNAERLDEFYNNYYMEGRVMYRIRQPYLPRSILGTIFRSFAIPVTAVYLVEHLDDRDNRTVCGIWESRNAAIVVIDNTTEAIRDQLATLFRRLSVRITRADGSTIFILDDLNRDYKTFDDILSFLSDTLEKPVLDYLTNNTSNRIRGCVFQLKAE